MMLVGSATELYPLGSSCSVFRTPFATSNKSWFSAPNHRNIHQTETLFMTKAKVPLKWYKITIDNTHQFILNWVYRWLTESHVNASWTFELHRISTAEKQAEYDKTVHALRKTRSIWHECITIILIWWKQKIFSSHYTKELYVLNKTCSIISYTEFKQKMYRTRKSAKSSSFQNDFATRIGHQTNFH